MGLHARHAVINLKSTGLAQNLGQLYGSHRDFQSNCWVNPVNFTLRTQVCFPALVSQREAIGARIRAFFAEQVTDAFSTARTLCGATKDKPPRSRLAGQIIPRLSAKFQDYVIDCPPDPPAGRSSAFRALRSKQVCTALLCGRAGGLTSKTAMFWPGLAVALVEPGRPVSSVGL